MATEFGTVPEKKKRLLLALLSVPTVEAAAEQAGVSLSTSYRWRRQPKFRRQLDRHRREVFDQGLAAMHALLGEAVDTLRRNLTCGLPNVDVAAVAKVAEIGLKFAEMADVTRRLEAVEEQMAATEFNSLVAGGGNV